MQQIRQLSLFVENRTGALSEVCRVMQKCTVNIRTLSLADTQQFGILRMLVDDPDKAKAALEAAGFVVKLTGVLALSVPDRSGGLAETLAVFDKYNIAVEYMYAFTFGIKGQAVIVFCVDKPEAALQALSEEKIELLDASALN